MSESPYIKCQNFFLEEIREEETDPTRLNHEKLVNWCCFLLDKYHRLNKSIEKRDTLINTLIFHVDQHVADHVLRISIDYLAYGGFFMLLYLTAIGKIVLTDKTVKELLETQRKIETLSKVPVQAPVQTPVEAWVDNYNPYKYRDYSKLCFDLGIDYSFVHSESEKIEKLYENLVNAERNIS